MLKRLTCIRASLTAIGSLLLTAVPAGATVDVAGGQTLKLDGPAQSLAGTSESRIGFNGGVATLLIQNGATLSSGLGSVGSFSSAAPVLIEGRVVVTGAGSRWDSAGPIVMGNNAVGSLIVDAGGVVAARGTSTSPAILIGVRSWPGTFSFPPLAETSIEGTSSQLQLTGGAYVGYAALGTLSIRNGGAMVTSPGPGSGSCVAGISGGSGWINVDGPQSVLQHGAGLYLGFDGSVSAESTGTLNASNQSRITLGSFQVGGEGQNGRGWVKLIDGARIDVTQTATLYRGGMLIDSGATANFNGYHLLRTGTVDFRSGGLHMGTLVLSGGTINQSSTDPLLSTMNWLQFSSTSNPAGAVNVGIGASAVDYTGASRLDAITAEVVRGRAGGAWSGKGINSAFAAANPGTHGVGVAEASETGLTSLFGQSFDSTTVLVRCTRLGDADLDGMVDLNDFTRLAANFGLPGRWFTGDFNYDGSTNLDDFTPLAANFGLASLATERTPREVPEPTCPAAVFAMIANVARRKR